MLRSQWLLRTVGATIITLVIAGMLASWQSETANSQKAHNAAFEAERANLKQQQQIDTLERCRRVEQSDRAVLREKLNNIEQSSGKTYELVIKLWEKSR